MIDKEDQIVYTIKDIYQHFTKTHGKILSRVEYNEIIKVVNTEFIETIVNEGSRGNLGGTLGFLVVIKAKRVGRNGVPRMVPDFYKSKLLKKEILDRGGLPLENYKDEEGNIIGNNGGEPWLIYRTDGFFYRIEWIKHTFASAFMRMMQFKMLRKTDGEVSILGKFAMANPEKAALIFGTKETVGMESKYKKRKKELGI